MAVKIYHCTLPGRLDILEKGPLMGLCEGWVVLYNEKTPSR